MSVRQRNSGVRRPSLLGAAPTPTETGKWPDIDARLLDVLEARYPPRCKDQGESEEAHLRYAGKVALVAELTAVYERQKADPSAVVEGP